MGVHRRPVSAKQSIHPPVILSINRPANQPTSRPTSQPTNQLASRPTNQPINHPLSQSANPSINRSMDQSSASSEPTCSCPTRPVRLTSSHLGTCTHARRHRARDITNRQFLLHLRTVHTARATRTPRDKTVLSSRVWRCEHDIANQACLPPSRHL